MATQVLGLGALLLSLLLLVPTSVLFVQVIAARRQGGPAAAAAAPLPQRPEVAVLMPAHDEALGIEAPIRSVWSQLHPGDRLLVVADNCSDDTAAVAASLGAQVVERHDTAARGKGHALDFGIAQLRQKPPAIVVIVDADCELHPASLDRLVAECRRSGRPVQSLYLMRSPPGAGLRTRIAEFAWLVRNRVRPLGCNRLGWPCQLMGTGMAFPWGAISGAALATGHIVEDMQLGLDLAVAGTPPLYCDDALVTSVFPETNEALLAQRTRWEHGHLGMIGTRVQPLLRAALIQRRMTLAAMAFDLGVPPLTSLAFGLLVVWAGTAALAATGGTAAPLAVATVSLAMFLAAVASAWWRFGRAVVSWSDWRAVPGYMLSKIPIYLRLYTARQREWVRTKRRDRTP